MRIGNPQDINGNPLLINVSVDNNYITGNGTSSNVLTFAGFPVYNTNGTIVVNKVKSIKAGEGISFSSDANQLIINANPVTDISDSIVKVININSTDNKVPTAKTVYNFVTSNFIQLINGKINNELINKADTLNYGIVKIGQGINVESGIISVPTIATTIANNITNPVAGNVIYNALETKLNKPTTGGQYGKVLSYKNNTQNVWIDITIPKIVSKFPQNLGNAGQILKVSNNATTLEWSNLESLSIDGSITSNGENAVTGSAVYQFVTSHASDMALHLPSGGTSGQILTKSNNNIVWDDPVKIDNQITSDSENAVAVNVVYNALQGKIDKPILINAAGYVLTVNNDENGFVVNPIDNALNGNSINAVQNKTVYSALQTKADSSDLNNYATELEFDINSQNYVISAVLKNNNVILTSRTIDLPLQTMVVSASYQSATKNLILTLKNNETVSCSISDIIDGLVPDNRTINNKALNDDINIYATDIKLNNQVNAKTISELLNEKGDMFLSDYVNQGGQGIVLSANNANYAISAGNIGWNNINGKPSEFNPVLHNHNISDINGIENITVLSANYAQITQFASNANHASNADVAEYASSADIAQFASSAGNVKWIDINGKPSEFNPVLHNHNVSDINDFNGNVSSIVSGMIQNISADIAQIASNANYASSAQFASSANIAQYASNAQFAEYASSAGYAQEVGQHNHSVVQITDFDSSVSSIVSIMIEDIDANNAQFASNANYAISAGNIEWNNVNGKPSEFNPISHNHNISDINEFDGNVSSIVSGMIENISADIAQIASSAGYALKAQIAQYASNAQFAQYASSAGYAQEVGQHNHSAVQITDFNGNVSSIVSGMLGNINISGNVNIATTSSLGIVKIGNGLNIDSNGELSTDYKSNELIFKIPRIESNDEFYHLNIEFSETDSFDSIISYNTSSSVSRFKVFTGMAMINFPSQGLGTQFSEEQVKFDISNINYKYYRFQWLVGYDENPSQLQGGRYGYGQTNGLLNVFDFQEYDMSESENELIGQNNIKQINITKENSEQIIWSTINQYGNNRYICQVQHNMNGYIFIQLFDNNGYGVPIIPYYIDANNIAFYIDEKPQDNETYKLICLSSGCSSNNNKNKSFNFTFLNSNYVTWNGNKATFIHNMNCIPIVTIYNNDKKQVFLSVEIIDANTIAVDFEKVISDTWKIIFTYGTEYDYN